MNGMLQRPNKNEYPDYYEEYIKLVPEGEMVSILKKNLELTMALFNGISESEGNYRYAPDKWSIKEVLGHMTDTERILSTRLLRIGRGDVTPLSGFNENFYVDGAEFDKQTTQNILDEFVSVRKATISLIKNMPEESWLRKGLANGIINTARSLVYSIAGHELHHCKIIQERYLQKKDDH